MQEEIKLKPCPFCGETKGFIAHQVQSEPVYNECTNCGCQAPLDIWNKRKEKK